MDWKVREKVKGTSWHKVLPQKILNFLKDKWKTTRFLGGFYIFLKDFARFPITRL